MKSKITTADVADQTNAPFSTAAKETIDYFGKPHNLLRLLNEAHFWFYSVFNESNQFEYLKPKVQKNWIYLYSLTSDVVLPWIGGHKERMTAGFESIYEFGNTEGWTEFVSLLRIALLHHTAKNQDPELEEYLDLLAGLDMVSLCYKEYETDLN